MKKRENKKKKKREGRRREGGEQVAVRRGEKGLSLGGRKALIRGRVESFSL
jgi:hypothetical protein